MTPGYYQQGDVPLTNDHRMFLAFFKTPEPPKPRRARGRNKSTKTTSPKGVMPQMHVVLFPKKWKEHESEDVSEWIADKSEMRHCLPARGRPFTVQIDGEGNAIAEVWGRVHPHMPWQLVGAVTGKPFTHHMYDIQIRINQTAMVAVYIGG